MTWVRKILILIVRLYQYVISPLSPPSCRYHPSCSEYAKQAIEEWGPGRGILLALMRILRCHPFSAAGYDPVARKNR